MGTSPLKSVVEPVERFESDRKVALSPDKKEEQLRLELPTRMATRGQMRANILTAWLVLLAITLAPGMEPEWTIYLPDSLSGLPGPQCVAYNPLTDKVYVGGSGNCVIVIDCATNAKVARIPTMAGCLAMFYNPASGRIYCVGNLLTVIDCAGDTVVKTLPVSRRTYCYNSRSQELYAYGVYMSRIGPSSPIIVDTKNDSIVDTLNMDATSLCYNSKDDRVYCGYDGGVKVLGGNDLAFVTDVPVKGGAGLLCYNPASNKVYCASYGNRNVTVIDGGTNLVLSSIVAGPGLVDICCDPRNNKVYLANGAYPPSWPFHEIGDSTVSVVDGTTDKVIATIATHGRPMVLSYDSASNRVVAACRVATTPAESSSRAPVAGRAEPKPTVDIIDGRSNRVTASAALGHQATAFCFNPRRGYAYCVVPDRDQPDVVALRVASGEVIAKVPTARHPGALCYNPRDNKLYCSIRRDGELVVLDGATNRFLSRVKTGQDPWRICYNSRDDKVYYDGGYFSRTVVLDGKTDKVISSLTIGSPVWYDSLNNWVYSFKEPWATGRVTVTDGATDSTIAEVPFREPWSFCGDPKAGKVYCHSDQTGELAIIDGPTQALVKTIQIGRGRHVLCCNYRDTKVYCAQETMKVLNGTTNVVDTTWFMPADAMCYNERNDKLYVGGRLGLSVLDAATNRVIANLSEYAGARNIYYDAGDNCVYCVRNNLVVVLDGASNEILRTYAVGHDMHALACNTKQNRIYVANQDGYDISVIRGGRR